MAHYAVSAIGRDRPGIVAGLSAALLDLEGNVEDSRMTILRGHFAVMLIVSVPDRVDSDAVDSRLAEVAASLDLEAVAANPVAELGEAPEATHVITVYGADRPGIVHAITSALAERGANITDLQTKLAGAATAPLYVMLLEVELDPGGAEEAERELREVAKRAEVEVTLRPLEAEAL